MPMEFNKPDVLRLEGNLEENFRTFKEEVEIYFTATETEKKSNAIQAARLKNLLGKEALQIYKDFKHKISIPAPLLNKEG